LWAQNFSKVEKNLFSTFALMVGGRVQNTAKIDIGN
jgi:hypothetical protein